MWTFAYFTKIMDAHTVIAAQARNDGMVAVNLL